MTREEAILRYKAAMAVFKNWHADGLVTADDLSVLNIKLARKYGLSSRSIYLEHNLLCGENRGIYGSVKGGYHEQKNHET
jgi:hypothetical protein